MLDLKKDYFVVEGLPFYPVILEHIDSYKINFTVRTELLLGHVRKWLNY